MHNIKRNSVDFTGYAKRSLKTDPDNKGNLQFYPRTPNMTDLQVISPDIYYIRHFNLKN